MTNQNLLCLIVLKMANAYLISVTHRPPLFAHADRTLDSLDVITGVLNEWRIDLGDQSITWQNVWKFNHWTGWYRSSSRDSPTIFYGWRRWVTWLKAAVRGILAFLNFPLLHSSLTYHLATDHWLLVLLVSTEYMILWASNQIQGTVVPGRWL